LSGELQVSLSGAHAWQARDHLSHQNALERTKAVERFLAQSLQSATVKESKYENADQPGQELKGRYSFATPEFLKSSGPLLLLKPCVFGNKAISIDWKKRKYPVDLKTTTQEVDSYEIALPAGLEVDDVPDTVAIDVGFASYKSSVTIAKGVVRYQREYVVRDPQVGMEKLGELRKLEEAILRDESATVVLKKKI
jgi:hypothetical protein